MEVAGGRRARDRAPLARLRRPAQRRDRRRRRDWILEIDADERITPRLRAEIEEFLATRPRASTSAPCPAATCSWAGAWALGEVPQVPAAAVPARRLPPRRAARRARGAVGVRADLGLRGRPRARAGRHASPRRSATPPPTRGWRRGSSADALRRRRIRGIVLPGREVRLPAGRRRRLARRLARPREDRAGLLGRRAGVGVRARRSGRGEAPAHYAQERVRRGPVRLLAIACGDHGRPARPAG